MCEHSRELAWPNCLNARDLGGMRTRDGGFTARGRIFRSDSPARLTEDGWAALQSSGVGSVLWLETVGKPADWRMPLCSIERRDVVVEDLNDPQFVSLCVETGLWCTPLYFLVMLSHWPSVCADIVRAVANASPAGVVVACERGRDRTGLAAFLVLALAGVEPNEIAADWELGAVNPQHSIPSYDRLLANLLARNETSVLGSIRDACDSFDVAEHLHAHGLSREDLGRVRRRLLGREELMVPNVSSRSVRIEGPRECAGAAIAGETAIQMNPDIKRKERYDESPTSFVGRAHGGSSSSEHAGSSVA